MALPAALLRTHTALCRPAPAHGDPAGHQRRAGISGVRYKEPCCQQCQQACERTAAHALPDTLAVAPCRAPGASWAPRRQRYRSWTMLLGS